VQCSVIHLVGEVGLGIGAFKWVLKIQNEDGGWGLVIATMVMNFAPSSACQTT